MSTHKEITTQLKKTSEELDSLNNQASLLLADLINDPNYKKRYELMKELSEINQLLERKESKLSLFHSRITSKEKELYVLNRQLEKSMKKEYVKKAKLEHNRLQEGQESQVEKWWESDESDTETSFGSQRSSDRIEEDEDGNEESLDYPLSQEL